MDTCANCGHDLGVGRFCIHYGHPAGVAVDPFDERTDTAERPRVPAARRPDAPPAPTWTPPPPARYPLFADETDPADPAPPARDAGDHPDRSRPSGLWAAIGVALVLIVVLGVALLSGRDEEATTQEPAPSDAQSAPADDDPSESARPEIPPGSVTADASVTVPQTAAPGRDIAGNQVRYDAANMLDGRPETAWRMPGDGTGEEIAIILAEESALRSVGLINGYAKQAEDRDWYHGNRRVEQVEWVFDDGTAVHQSLGDSTGVQSVDVDVTTTTITLRLVAVSAPGAGRDSRNFTAISDLLLVAGP